MERSSEPTSTTHFPVVIQPTTQTGDALTEASNCLGREDAGAPGELEINNTRQGNSGSNYWLQIRSDGKPKANSCPVVKDKCQRDGTNEPRDTEALGQRGHSAGLRGDSRRLLLQDFSCAQERGTIQTGNKPAPSKQLDTLLSFQNGRNPCCEGPFIKKGLPNSDRSQGCLFDNSGASPFPQIPPLPVARPGFRIYLSAFRANISPPCVYKSHEDRNCLLTGQRDQMCDLPRRPPADEQKPGSSKGTNLNSIRHTGSIRIFGELPQIPINTGTGSGISGIPHQFSPQRITTPQVKVRSDRSRGRSGASQGGSLSKTISPVDWQDVSSHSSNLPSATSLQKLASTETQGSSQIRLRWNDQAVTRGKGGSAVVDEQLKSMEWPDVVTIFPTLRNRDGRLHDGLGSLLSRGGNWRMLEPRGAETPYQRARTASSLLCSEVFLEEGERYNSISQVGQYSCGVSHQQARWHQIPTTNSTDKTDIRMVSTEADQSICSTPPREGKSNSRLLVQIPKRQDRLDTQCQCFQSYQPALGSPGGRSLCNKIFSSTRSILQLESRPRGHGDGCIYSALGSHTSICSSSMVPNLPSVDENTNGENNSSTNYPTVESSAMVSSAANHGDRLPNTASRCARSTDPISELRLPSEGQSPLSGRLEGIRQHLTAKQISSKATRLILSSWRDKTNTNYNSAWKKWENWCRGKHVPPFAADVSAILSFLADEFEEGKQYRSLNCYRSAISSTHLPIEGIPVGQHPLVIRLLKGAFNLRPPKPRYSQTWDVSLMLTFLRNLGRNEELSLKRLTQKLIMLLALVLGHRCSDLVRLTLTGRCYTRDGVLIPCVGLAKQARPNNEQSLHPVEIRAFKDEQLCPVSCVKAYEEATVSFRGGEERARLFLAVIAPHNPLSSSSIARWIKKSLVEAGLDRNYTAHSTRSASTTAAAMAGISTKEIMSRAGWSREDTFSKFYYRPQSVEDYSKAILQTCKETC